MKGRHQHKLTDRNNVSERYPTFFNGDSISGTVIIKLNSSSLKHKGIKVELHGIIQKHGTITTTACEFLSAKQEISPAAEIFKEKTNYEFNFKRPRLKYESYKGNYASVKYFIKIIIETSIISPSYEKEFAVVNPFNSSVLRKNDSPLILKVGVKNVLSLSINFEHSNLDCRGILRGFVTFNLVNSKIKCMEIQLIRREIIFDGKKYEPEYLARYEIVDGGPCKYEKLPIRLFLKSYNLTPSYPNIEDIFGVKYFINFIVVDAEDNRYFKFSEVSLFRLFSDRRKHMHNYDNNGLFISEPFFEDECIYGNDSYDKKYDNNENNLDENNYNEYDNGNYDMDNYDNNRNNDDYYDENDNMINNKYNNNRDNNMVLNIPGGDDYDQNNNNINLRNKRNNNYNDYNWNNMNSKRNQRFEQDSNDDYNEEKLDDDYDYNQNNNDRNQYNRNENNNYNKNEHIFNNNRENNNFNNYQYDEDFNDNYNDNVYNENNSENYNNNNNYKSNNQNQNRNNNYMNDNINNNQFENNIDYINEKDFTNNKNNIFSNDNRNRMKTKERNLNYINQNNRRKDNPDIFGENNQKNNTYNKSNNNFNKNNIFGNDEDFNDPKKQNNKQPIYTKNKSNIFGNDEDFSKPNRTNKDIYTNKNKKNLFGDDFKFNDVGENNKEFYYSNNYEENINDNIEYIENRNKRNNNNYKNNDNYDIFNNNKNNSYRNNNDNIINFNNNNSKRDYNNNQNLRQKYQNNIFGDNPRQDNNTNSRRNYKVNNIFGDNPENKEIQEEGGNEYNRRNKNNLMNKRISNENDFNNIFGPS